MERTLDYIEGPRRRLVERFKKLKGKGYTEPPEIFLSHKTGRPLNLRSISNIFRQVFDAAGVEGHGHRIRAHFLENVVDAEAEAEEIAVTTSGGRKAAIDWHGVQMRAAEHARHRNPSSLDSYVRSIRKQRMRAPEQE